MTAISRMVLESDIILFIRIWAFEFCKTFLIFSVIPVSVLTDFFRKNTDGVDLNYNITLYQYFFYPIVGGSIFLLSSGAAIWIAESHHLLFAAMVGAIFSLGLTGGMSHDGFSDTADALYSWPIERKYSVIKEPQVGSIGMIFTVLAILAYVVNFTYALWFILDSKMIILLATLIWAFIIPRVACYYILCYYYQDNMIEGKLMRVIPSYGIWSEPKDSIWNTTCVYLLTIFLFSLSIKGMLSYVLIIGLLDFILIRFLTRRWLINLGFLNGDTMGALTVILDIFNLFAFILLFVYI